MRAWLRVVGLALVAVALALDLALLAFGDLAMVPGPVGQVAGDHLMPWAQDAVLPLAVRLGLVQLVEAGEPEPGEVPTIAAIPPPQIVADPTAAVTPVVHNPTEFPEPSPTAILATPSPAATPTLTPVGAPTRILAPSIGLDAPIVAVKVDASGAMGTPRTAGEVGWYGPRPGEQGNALFAGHVDWVVAGKAVKGSFYLLTKLNPGDLVNVRSSDGKTRVFRVDWKRYYQASTAPVDEIAGPTEYSSITLITCGGQFDRNLRSYVGRWVVRASLVESQ